MEKRTRLLPSRTMAYYVMGLAMFSQSSYEEVMRMLLTSESWSSGRSPDWPVPTKAALVKARARLGADPLRSLFAEVATPIAAPDDPRSFYRGWRLMSIDSACLDVPNSPTNMAAFGTPSTDDPASSPLPQVQVLGLTETGTRSIVDAVVGGVRDSDSVLAAELVPRIPKGALVLAGSEYFPRALWMQASSRGSELLLRVTPERTLTVDEVHDDGSYRSRVPAGTQSGAAEVDAMDVRIIEPSSPDPQAGAGAYRLATTILDPSRAPASELAAIDAQRWEIASAFDELKAHHLSPRVVLRSRDPDGVHQEVFGYLCVHFAIRWLLNSPWEDNSDTGSGPRAGGH